MEKYPIIIPDEIKTKRNYVDWNKKDNLQFVDGQMNEEVMKEFRVFCNSIPKPLLPHDWKQIIAKYENKKYQRFDVCQIPTESEDGKLVFLKDGFVADTIEMLNHFPEFPCGKVNWDIANVKVVHNMRFILTVNINSFETVIMDLSNSSLYSYVLGISDVVIFVKYTNYQDQKFVTVGPFMKLYKSGYMNNTENKQVLHSFNDYPSNINYFVLEWHSNGKKHRDGDNCSSIEIINWGLFSHVNKFKVEISYRKFDMLSRIGGKPAVIVYNFFRNPNTVYQNEESECSVSYGFYYEGFPCFYFPFFHNAYSKSSFIFEPNRKQQLQCCFIEIGNICNDISIFAFEICLMVRQNKITKDLAPEIITYFYPQVPTFLIRFIVLYIIESMWKIKLNKITLDTNKGCFSAIN